MFAGSCAWEDTVINKKGKRFVEFKSSCRSYFSVESNFILKVEKMPCFWTTWWRMQQWIITEILTHLNRCSLWALDEHQSEHPEVGLSNPKGLQFSNHNRGVIYVPVTRRDLNSDWAQRRHAIDLHGQESQLPLKPWQWNCMASIGSAAAPPYYL